MGSCLLYYTSYNAQGLVSSQVRRSSGFVSLKLPTGTVYQLIYLQKPILLIAREFSRVRMV